MSEAKTCYSCGTTFWTSTWTNKCTTCQQTESFTRQAELNRQQDYELQQEQLNQQRAIALLGAMQAQQTAKAIERQTQAIFEASIPLQEAYDRGYNYIDNEFGEYAENPADLRLTISQTGEITWTYDDLYITPSHQKKWTKGLQDRMNSFPSPGLEFMKRQAYYAGRQSAEGKLETYFSLYTGVEINGQTIYTKVFASNFNSYIEEDTGILKMSWNNPFTIDELNEEYKVGASEVYHELNTEELKQHRLTVEIPLIKEKRIKEQKEKEEFNKKRDQVRFNDGNLTFLIYTFLILGWIVGWNFTEGWWTFLTIIVIVPLLTFCIAVYHNMWKDENKEYL